MNTPKREKECHARSRLEPAVKHFLNTLQHALALLRRNLDVINLVAMQVGQDAATRQLVQLFDGRDADDLMARRQLLDTIRSLNRAHLLHVITSPKRQWRTPIPVPRHVPVSCVLEPALETVLADRSRDPARFLVVFDELFCLVLHANEPNRDSAVDERRSGADDMNSVSRERTWRSQAKLTASRMGTSAE